MNRDILQVLVLSSLAQLAGFGKAILITYYFGVSALLDGYYLAQAVPATLAGMLVGFFQTGFAPLYNAHLVRGEQDEAASLLGGSLLLAAGFGLLLSVLVSMSSPALVAALLGSDTTSIATTTVNALRALAFLLVLNALVDCLGLALNAHHRYVIAAAAPILNAVSATAILAAAPEWGLTNLIVGTLLGVFVQLILVLAAVHRASIRLAWGKGGQLAESLRSGGAMLPGLVFSNCALIVPAVFAARIGEGAVTALSIASRLHGALIQVLAIALSTVLLPHFAQAVARNERERVADSLKAGFGALAALGVAVVAWISLAGPALISAIFERGAFDAEATDKVASTWLWLAVGLVPAVWGTALAKALQALQLGGLLSLIAAIALAALVLGCVLGVALEQLSLIAYATALSAAISAAMCGVAASRFLLPATQKRPALPNGVSFFLVVSLAALAAAFLALPTVSRAAAVVLTIAFLGVAVTIALKRRGRDQREVK